ncbi:chromosome segregation protein SMC [Nitrosomonas supralitoralis]|uniref:Chromosome partition protein Smc n=1 Tax=Nitrosomonas supralitoralis TaxID=2116706 RepID=A0A2P7NZH9_9PROT|nr:chromosome segregation protein SMC [Nitrosomonas supralitoralis]PSJ18848.1 chromosome segregation protein SMC [Nitrosomonas supralitoralis]
MRLAYIKLAGFKSFAEPTTITIFHNLVGIVGPNGCGKSNVIDAVRWVLGESKASALRGDSMQDVIFSGSGNRKAIGRASVEIVFDNHLNKITGQWSSYTEIAIKRTLQRNGVSSYFINNLQVRRRDIADLFLGTGVGGQGYAIIEQGMISRIIEAKPQELKSFLEEAAGISQYRERRHETSLRLTETRKNLIRLEDIRQELETQLQHLETQANIAMQYKLLQDELHKSQSLLWLQRRADAILQRDSVKKEIHKIKTKLEVTLAVQRNAEKEFEVARKKEQAVNEQLLQIQGQLYSADAEIGRLQQEITFLRSTQDRLTQQTQQVDAQLQKSYQLKETNSENLRLWQQQKSEAELSHQCSIHIHNEENNKLPVAETKFLGCQKKLNEYKHSLLTIEQANQLEENQLSYAKKSIQQLDTRLTRLSSEQAELIFVESSMLTELQSKIDQIECALKAENLKCQNLENHLSKATKNKQQITSKIQELQHALTQATARFTALNNLQSRLNNNQDLNTWLRKHQLTLLPRLWQKIHIKPEWENALEAVLRERLNSIETEQLNNVLNWIDDSPNLKWTIFEKNQSILLEEVSQAAINHQLNCEKLLSFITVNQPEIRYVLENWLYPVYAIEDVKEGLIKRATLRPDEIIVTRQGHIINRSSLTFYAPDSDLHGVLSRQQELIQTQTEIDQYESILQQQRTIISKAEHQCIELANAIQSANENSKQSQEQRHKLQLELVRLTQTNERTIHRNEQINSELNEIKQTLAHEISSQEAAKARFENNLIQIEVLKKDIKQAQSTWEAADQELANLRQKILLSAKEIQEITFHVKTCQNKVTEIETHIQANENDLQKYTEDRANLLKEAEVLDTTQINILLQDAQAQRKLIEQSASQVRLEATDITRNLQEVENTRMTSEQESHLLRESMNKLQLKEQAATISMHQFDALINDANADTELLLPLINKKSTTALKSEIDQLNAEIAELGSVNLAALEELKIARARESNLLAQLQDLSAAIATLDSAIQQIDRETQNRLQETFLLVNTYLDEIFPVIFAGGEAKLEFCDNKILDAGLLLMAQPPGKKNSSIHLLSGGEKALTALALIFSLFRLNPAPFCLLDEVDAPLDDSNTKRFCEIVKNMAKQTQFLYISHNKITMEMAQRLIGVTMQEQGVSRIVAVDLADAIKMGKKEELSVT